MRAIVRATFVFVVLACMPGALESFATIKAAGLLVVAALIVGALIAHVAISRRSPLAGGARAFDAAMLAICAVTLLSAWHAPSAALAWRGELTQREGVLVVSALVALGLGVRASHASARDVQRTLDVMLVSASAAAAYAVLQFAGHDPIAWAGAQVYDAGGVSNVRPGATLGNANLLGVLLAATIAGGAARLVQDRVQAWWLAPSLVLCSVALTMTLSRGAALAAACGLAVALLPAVRRAALRPGAALAIAATVVPALAMAAGPLRAAWASRALESTVSGSGSLAARAGIAHAALAMWRSQSWLGVGPDHFAFAFPRFMPADFWHDEILGIPMHAHSAALQILATGGVALAAAYAACGAALARPLVRSRSRARLAPILVALLVAGGFGALGHAGAALLVIAAALACAPGEDRAAADAPARGRIALAIGAFAALAALPVVTRTVVAVRVAGGAAAAAEAGELASARTLAAGALALAPDEESLARLAADVALDGDAPDTAAAALHVARLRTLAPGRAATEQRVLELAWARGDRLGAAAALARARALAPYDALLLADDARLALQHGDAAHALASARACAALAPHSTLGPRLAAAAAAALAAQSASVISH